VTVVIRIAAETDVGRGRDRGRVRLLGASRANLAECQGRSLRGARSRPDYAEVTEELWPTGIWERGRYEWSPSGPVIQTVLDANALLPGSTWELTAVAGEGTTRVEAVFVRDFRRTPRGLFAHVVNRLAGRWLAGMDLRHALSEIEKSADH
jgi:hypothetical protein